MSAVIAASEASKRSVEKCASVRSKPWRPEPEVKRDSTESPEGEANPTARCGAALLPSWCLRRDRAVRPGARCSPQHARRRRSFRLRRDGAAASKPCTVHRRERRGGSAFQAASHLGGGHRSSGFGSPVPAAGNWRSGSGASSLVRRCDPRVAGNRRGRGVRGRALRRGGASSRLDRTSTNPGICNTSTSPNTSPTMSSDVVTSRGAPALVRPHMWLSRRSSLETRLPMRTA